MNDRAADSHIDFTAAGKQITLFPREVLDAIPTATQTLLPFKGVASPFSTGKEGPTLVLELKEAQVTTACPPQAAAIYASSFRFSQVESQCDMFEMSQGGA